MNPNSHILIAGTGPVSIQMAVLLKQRLQAYVGIAGRPSSRSAPFFESLRQHEHYVYVEIQNEKHQAVQGECRVDELFYTYNTVAGSWDTLVLAVTADAYIEVLSQLHDDVLRQLQCVLLLSPTLGSGSLVRQYMQDRRSDAEIISCSTYLGATRWTPVGPSHRVLTTAVKRKVYFGSTHTSSSYLEQLRQVYEAVGIQIETMSSPFEAEARNISLYVHPPLFMNEFTLDVVFSESSSPATVKKYVYKLYPEGPITQQAIRDMRTAWNEISALLERMSLKGVNLLKFMADDNYPVRPESLQRDDMERFEQLDAIHQEYLLYVRYTSLLIDPFSEPDEHGRYFDFSAVPIRPMFIGTDGRWDIPRMPKEDYYRIKIIQGIARHLRSSCPTIDRFIAVYEHRLEEAARQLQGQPMSDAFEAHSFADDIERICKDIAGIKA
ncbi:opine metallophore biosynthesis dehydrogenase [Paenibacillus sp. YYML68]|uniref:opine metallophore biosynthesis dehydrogenase n=1 Tax=Paenibacillus sp. YYML68 TaxID=2909250 RepID=UPI0024916CA1|nr:opine metallophore biosynthesis dehydrogenase [Paenibacillus sp. YYML68]